MSGLPFVLFGYSDFPIHKERGASSSQELTAPKNEMHEFAS